MTDMKILFLDIDGVLNSRRSWIGYKRSYADAENGPGWDPVAVGLLQRLVTDCDLFIVISSAWRIGLPNLRVSFIEQWQEWFAVYGWENAPVIDRTEISKEDRWEQIRRYVIIHEPSDYVILDDYDVTNHSDHMYTVNNDVGLDIHTYNAIRERFGLKKHDVWL